MAFTTPLTNEDPDKQLQLDRMKRRATALLALSTAIFGVALFYENAYPWVGYVRATAEAAIVGGLADWFAVTALFRHPLGIPIPHTAIVPANKDRIGRSLGNFVQRNFLAPEVIATRLETLGLAERVLRWLIVPEHADRLSRSLARSLAGAAQVLKDEDVQAWMDSALAGRIRKTQAAPLLGRVLAVVTAGGRHQRLLDNALQRAERFVDENEALIRERVRAETPWWFPNLVEEKIHEKIVDGIKRTLDAVSKDPEHPLRHRLNAALETVVDRLQHAPEVATRFDTLKEEALAHPAVREFTAALWSDVKQSLIDAAERQDQDTGVKSISRGLQSIGRTVLEDETLLAKIDAWLIETGARFVAQYREEVGKFISDTVAGWDAQITSHKVELQIGRDLQFVRINGTVVGGLVGLILYTIIHWVQ